MKILLTTKLPTEGFTGINQHELIMPENSKFTYEELESLIHDADILIPTFDYKIDENLISKASKLRLITNFGVGFNNIDLKAAKERNIIVTNTPDPVIEPTAEHAFTLMLSICHRIAELDYKLRFEREKIEFGVMNNLGIAIYGKTLGIIGMGNIGKSVAKRASACGMKILYHNQLKNSRYSCELQEASSSFLTIFIWELLCRSASPTRSLPFSVPHYTAQSTGS